MSSSESDESNHENPAELLALGLNEESVNQSLGDATTLVPVEEKAGDTIGRYHLIEKVGEGGMGVVYRASQKEPVEREVALKILKLGMDTKEVIARFEVERQAIALMQHPNIASVLDAGMTSSGRPYFCMELISGVPITDYCDQERLSTRERLELFRSVCAAIQHAHQKGIIHRDIKPSNILVRKEGGISVLKIIDFGIAKATQQRLTEKTLFTRMGVLIGTPAYMSPEQADLSSIDIDTRTDVYSLGVLLYELLTGSPPFSNRELRSGGYAEMQDIILRKEPPKPSTRLTSVVEAEQRDVAELRSDTVQGLRAALRSDLDWIVMKALEKERDQRYGTPNEFSEDIHHFLNDAPVSAAAPSLGYQLRKAYRRNRGLAHTVMLIMGILVIATGVSVYQAMRAIAAEAQQSVEAANAKSQAEIAEAVNDFLNLDLLGSASPANEPDRDIKLRDVLDRAAVSVGSRFRGKPEVEAAIRATLAEAFMNLGETASADIHASRALELQHANPDFDVKLGLRASLVIGRGQLMRAQYEASIRTLKEALAKAIAELGDVDRVTQQIRMGLAKVYEESSQFAASSDLLEECRAIQTRFAGPSDLLTLGIEAQMSKLYKRDSRYREAQTIILEGLQKARADKTWGAHEVSRAFTEMLHDIYYDKGLYDKAFELVDGLVAQAIEMYGEDHLITLDQKRRVAMRTSTQNRPSVDSWQELYDQHIAQFGIQHPYTLIHQVQLAIGLSRAERYEESETYRADALARAKHESIVHGWDSLWVQYLAASYDRDRARGEAELVALLERTRRVLGRHNFLTAQVGKALASRYFQREEWDAVYPLQKQLAEARLETLGIDSLPCAKAFEGLIAASKNNPVNSKDCEDFFRSILDRCRRDLEDLASKLHAEDIQLAAAKTTVNLVEGYLAGGEADTGNGE